MNRLFNLKACIILFALVICQAELRAQSVSKEDTTKKKGSSMVVKSDTALIVKAGATIVQKADTTMVINADPELIRKFNEIVAAKQQADQVTQNKADSAASKQNTFTQTRTTPPANQPDNSASAPASSTVPVSAVNPGGTTTSAVTGAATSAVTGAAKTDASIPSQANNTNNTQPANNAPTTNQVASTAPANKPDSTSSANTQQSAANTNSTPQQSKQDSASASNNNAGVQSQKADSTKQVASDNTPAAKPDSTLTASNDTTKAKKDTTLKSDTSKMKKDTSLMVTDTAAHVMKAKAVFLEVGGAGLAISANYDSRFHDERNGWGYRVGAGFFSSGGNTVFTVPFQVNYLTGEHSMHIELGAGTTFLNSTGTNIGTSKWEFDKVTGFIATATIGFRYQPEHKGLNFRLAFTPILYDEGLMPVGGVSIGYTFK